MKTIAFLFAMFLGSLLYGQDTQNSLEKTGIIKATVPNLNSEEGDVLFALYTEDNFLKEASIYPVETKIENGKAYATFENVPSGTNAIVVLHDRNSNKRMDFDANGIPKEDYGASGNLLSYGPPNWAESKFEYDGKEKAIEIRF